MRLTRPRTAGIVAIYPIGGYANYASLRAAIADSTITQIVIRVSEGDVGGSDDDGAVFIIPNILGFYHGAATQLSSVPGMEHRH